MINSALIENEKTSTLGLLTFYYCQTETPSFKNPLPQSSLGFTGTPMFCPLSELGLNGLGDLQDVDRNSDC